ncbi:glycoside hydrolase family 55 protein [Annulohypoxylon truncatum]|uniref:glycoside hydrolase family 55 protein n=1 Tax=Annulohypoxylon truncatum TaxID=327061 RepID=UPI002007E56E|nr:glycoside hydrolase family 55 protein [Annulohypoxylon truncatum]KAI1212403.1 glycoside hydrolase family 55 protein [Annulohypoxylon truncatum]
MGLSKVLAASLLALRLFSGSVEASQSTAVQQRQSTSSDYWVADIKRQGVAVYADPGYQVFRNVKDYGAKGDGTTDDTQAINRAVQDGANRCITHCDSRTSTPAIVYFPPGVYMVSNPINQTYYTQFIGDANDIPTIKALPNFDGMAVIDANPYDYSQQPAANWYINQNNFFRQVRNFIIDIKDVPINKGACIHWQVAQATSLQNIVFEMNPDTSDANAQKGLYIENGSGGFMADLTFNGGGMGAYIGSQQYTSRNMTFNNCNTAIYLIWNWLWLLQDITINGGKIGIDMASDSLDEIKVGSLLLLDSKISNVPVGINTLYKPENTDTNNTLIVDNVDMTEGVPAAIQYAKDKSVILQGNQKVTGFTQGRQYDGSEGKAIQTAKENVRKPNVLLGDDGKVFTRIKPQYESVPSSSFVSVKTAGAKGDGKTDDTAAIQKIFDSAKEGDVIYFDHGAYLISDTVKIPKNIKITGEMWPLLMATGKKFTDQTKPVPVFQVGDAGDVGDVEMSDLIIETQGPLPGAILMQWNLAGSTNGAAGMWDVHFRIGGTAGTELQSDKCAKNENVTTTATPECMGTFMMLHITQTASAYIENCWFWVADHELDLNDHSQINIFNGRGVLIESQKPVWLWGTASEHSILYNYQVSNAQNVFLGIAQSETAYFQGNPPAPQGATVLEGFVDPDFDKSCDGSSDTCARTWGLRVTNSSSVYVYGTGLYSFFNNYGQKCVDKNNCQDNMISIEGSTGVHLYGVSTKASVNMISVDGQSAVLDKDNRNNFCAAIAKFEVDVGGSKSPASSSAGAGSSTISASETTLSGTVVTASASASISGSIPGSGSGSSASGTPSIVTDTQATATPASTPAGSYVPPGGESTAGTSATGSVAGSMTASVTTIPIPSETPNGGSGSSSSTGDAGDSGDVTVTITQTVTAAGTCSQSP